MKGKNAWLEKQQAAKNNVMHSAENLTKQYMLDTLCIAIHESEGWGYDRIKRLLNAWMETQEEYRLALNPSNSEADVAQEHLDRMLIQIINGLNVIKMTMGKQNSQQLFITKQRNNFISFSSRINDYRLIIFAQNVGVGGKNTHYISFNFHTIKKISP